MRCHFLRTLALEVDELDFFGVDGTLEEASANAGETLGRIGGQEPGGALTFPAREALTIQRVAYGLGGGRGRVDNGDGRTHGGTDGTGQHGEMGAT